MANIKLTELSELLTVNNSNTILYAANLSVSPNVSHYIRAGTLGNLTDYTTANAAFARANTAYSTGYNANVALNIANLSFAKGNVAHNQANTATTTAQAAFNAGNTTTISTTAAFNRANAAFVHANSAYNAGNTTTISTTAAFNRANAAFVHANSAYNLANSISVSSVTVLAQAAFNKANSAVMKAGDAITGVVTAPTAANTTSNTMLATTEFVQNSIGLIPNNNLGVGQTWQDMKLVRALNTLYTNTTSKPMSVSVSFQLTAVTAYGGFYINDVLMAQSGKSGANADRYTFNFVVPVGNTYKVAAVSGTISILNWSELR